MPTTPCPAIEVQAKRLREVCLTAFFGAPPGSARRMAARGCTETAALAERGVATHGCAFAEAALRKAIGLAGLLGLRVAGVIAVADTEPAHAGVGSPCLDGLCGVRRRKRRARKR